MGSDEDEFRKVNLGSRCEWHPETVSRLLDSYGEKCSRGKGYLKTKDWEEIVRHVNIQCEGAKTGKTMKQCREKVDSLKRRYKLEKRKAEIRGSNHVEWSFFEKLDEIMRSLKKNGSVSEGQSFELVEAMDFEVDRPDGYENHHVNNSNNHHDIMNNNHRLDVIVPEVSIVDKGKGLLESTDGLCDVVLNAVGYSCDNHVGRLELPQPAEKAHKRRKSAKGLGLGVSERPGAKLAKSPVSDNPVQALADALVGFSEVYSRIEVAKMELFTKMNLELAKLRKRRRKNSGSESGFSSSSASGSSDSDE
eukprot:Gb_00608 [translate_table: standard]